ncbi:MAG: type II toxin-antitoxin system PemK/MazF family toxin [Oscillospiraceae bacterium]|nr:type II toxin-antitoxin system PemK/MazF family toxin [Oscillospiraceae bacterium]
MRVKRGDIFYADFGPVQGSEQGGVRPCLIVQNDIGNIHSPTVVVVPLTGSNKAYMPTHVRITRMGGLRFNSIALCEQLRTIDRTRLDGFIGRIDSETQATIDAALSASLELPISERRETA